MQTLYDLDPPQKKIYLNLNSDLLKISKVHNINLSTTLEQALQDKLKKWGTENKKSIKSYNDFIAEYRCFFDGYR